jgi:hypothetical protein
MSIFKKSVEKIQDSWKSYDKKGNLHEGLNIFMIISRWILLITRNISDKVAEKINTRILYSITFIRKWFR